MNDDIRGVMSRALPEDLPAPRIEMDTLERKGEGLARRRKFGITGLATAGVVVVAALAITVPTVFAGANGGEQNGAAGTEEQKSYPLPDLDPDKKYDWLFGEDEETKTKETKELTESFWEYLSDKYPDLKIENENYEGDGNESGGDEPGGDEPGDEEGGESSGGKYLEPGEYPAMTRAEQALGTVKPDTEWPDTQADEFLKPTGYEKPVYGLPPSAGRYGAARTILEKDADYLDLIDVSVHPKGSFLDGAKSIEGYPGRGPQAPYLSEGCKDEIDDSAGGPKNYGYEYDCEETTATSGEKVHRIELTVNAGKSNPGHIVYRVNTVIVTLDNGNAVAINDFVEPLKGKDEQKPTMDLDELTKLALALPEVVVK